MYYFLLSSLFLLRIGFFCLALNCFLYFFFTVVSIRMSVFFIIIKRDFNYIISKRWSTFHFIEALTLVVCFIVSSLGETSDHISSRKVFITSYKTQVRFSFILFFFSIISSTFYQALHPKLTVTRQIFVFISE